VRSVAKMVVWLEGIGMAINLIVFFSPTCRLKIPGYVTFGNVCGKGCGFVGKRRRENKNVPFILVAVGEHTAESWKGKIIVFLRPEPTKPLSP